VVKDGGQEDVRELEVEVVAGAVAEVSGVLRVGPRQRSAQPPPAHSWLRRHMVASSLIAGCRA
jgi:hypothetical protein